jgi:heat shock protein HtpX
MAAWGGMLFGGDRRDNDGEGILEVLALVILAPLAATLLRLALSRNREFEADRAGARLIGDGEPLARALSKIDTMSRRIPMPSARPEMAGMWVVSPLAGRRVNLARWFSDHPPTAERIARLRATSSPH